LRVTQLPQKIFCTECGSILYNGLELETPTEIIQRHNGICPQCKKKLEFDTERVKIAPSEAQAR
jgi:RNase P subunit RPR2